MISQQRDPASFRDPSGFVFLKDGTFYRQINICYRDHYDHLVKSGLLAKLTLDRLLLPHEEAEANLACEEGAFKVMKPQRLEFVSYPYEWCFSQLRDAARTTLLVQQQALEHGMTLKDASAYNIQFVRGRPLFIDLLSFQKLPPGQPWVGYRQFCEHFLAPLALASYTDVRLPLLLRLYPDGIPLDLTACLLPWRSILRLTQLVHIHLHARSQKRYADRKVIDRPGRMNKAAHLRLIDNLLAALKGLRWRDGNTGWVDYYQDTNYSPEAWEQKVRITGSYFEFIKPHTAWDLGANTGEFSRLASQKGIKTIAFDKDPGSVEHNYVRCRAESEPNILPLILDLTNPSPAIGWGHQERKSLLARGPVDMVIALALTHHLAVSNNLPLEMIAAFFARICRHLVIEFVPKSDSQVQRLLANREDIFQNYNKQHFETAFENYFRIRDCTPIRSSERVLYLMESLPRWQI